MGAEIIPLVRQEAVDAAWLEYRDHVARSFDDRTLLTDRAYMERGIRLHEKFRRLFARAVEL